MNITKDAGRVKRVRRRWAAGEFAMTTQVTMPTCKTPRRHVQGWAGGNRGREIASGGEISGGTCRGIVAIRIKGGVIERTEEGLRKKLREK